MVDMSEWTRVEQKELQKVESTGLQMVEHLEQPCCWVANLAVLTVCSMAAGSEEMKADWKVLRMIAYLVRHSVERWEQSLAEQKELTMAENLDARLVVKMAMLMAVQKVGIELG